MDSLEINDAEMGGAEMYLPPQLEVIEVIVECGYATSGRPNDDDD